MRRKSFREGNMKINRALVLLLAVAFGLIITVSLASADYVVLKDKNGICRVIQSDHKTPKTIAGPFKTKEEAVKAKEKECATASVPTKEKEPGFLEKRKEKAAEKAKQKAEEKAKQKTKQKEDKGKPTSQ